MNEHAELFRQRDTPTGKHRRYMAGFQLGASGNRLSGARSEEYQRGFFDGGRALLDASLSFAKEVGYVAAPTAPTARRQEKKAE